MVRCASQFRQVVDLFSRREFYQLAINHKDERYSKGFSSWDHFMAMLFLSAGPSKEPPRDIWRISLHYYEAPY